MNMRLDICFVFKTLGEFLTDPRHVHLIAANHILRYLRGTVDYGLKYEANQNINLKGYVDSYWAGSAIDRKSTSWCSRKPVLHGTKYNQGKICCHFIFGR